MDVDRDRPFRDLPLEQQIEALRAELDALRAARVAREPRPWSWGRFALGVLASLVGLPAIVTVVAFVVLLILR